MLKAYTWLMALTLFISACNGPLTLGGDRPAKLYFPAHYDPSRAYPLIFFLHGYASSGPLFDKEFSASKDASELGYLALIPEGTPDSEGKNFWNATPECCDYDSSGRDDVSYLHALIEEAKASVPVSEITVFGHSNGGFMAQRLACEIPEEFVRVISIAGGMFRDNALCVKPASLPILQVHGTADETVPYNGSAEYPGAQETVDHWVEILGCQTTRETLAKENLITLLPDDGPDGKETDEQLHYNCRDQSRVGLWTVNGGLHNNAFDNLLPKALSFFTEAL